MHFTTLLGERTRFYGKVRHTNTIARTGNYLFTYERFYRFSSLHFLSSVFFVGDRYNLDLFDYLFGRLFANIVA